MPSPEMQPQPGRKSYTASQAGGKTGDMPNVPSSVSFDSSGGATIDIGSIDSSVTSIEVTWGGEEVYSSDTPNAAGQSAISAPGTSGTVYALQVLILYPNWTRPDIFSGSYTARPNTNPSQSLPRTQSGGTTPRGR